MPDYMLLVSKYHPTVGANCDGDPTVYANLSHADGDPLPSQAVLDGNDLDAYKEAKILSLSKSCEADIINGFQSEANGLHTAPGKWYDSDREDQINLVGSVAAGDTMAYACRDSQGAATKSYIIHTHAQLEKVLQDGRDIKLSKLQTFTTKRDQVLAAADKAAVDAITWS